MNFEPHMKQLFALRGRTSTYTPLVGAAVTCKAIRQGGGRPIQLGPVRVTPEKTCFHVKRSDIALPVAGADLLWGDETFTIDGVQPVERDADGLLWQLDASWGSNILYRSVSGSGVSQNPPQGTGFTVASSVSAGVLAISIKSGFTTGKLLDGDKFTIAGDLTRYTVTGAGMQAAANQFTAVPFLPALAYNAAATAVVTFDYLRDYALRGAIAGYEAREMRDTIHAGDRRLIVLQSALDAAEMTDVPKAADRVTFEDRIFNVIAATAIYQGSEPYAWDVQLRFG